MVAGGHRCETTLNGANHVRAMAAPRIHPIHILALLEAEGRRLPDVDAKYRQRPINWTPLINEPGEHPRSARRVWAKRPRKHPRDQHANRDSFNHGEGV